MGDGMGPDAGTIAPDRAAGAEGRGMGAEAEAILEGITVGLMGLDRDWTIRYANAEAGRLVGRPRSELIGRDHWDLFPEALGTITEANYRRVVAERVGVEFEYHHATWDRWFAIKADPAAGGGITAMFRDITGKKRAEAELRRSEATLRAFYDSSPVHMGLVEPTDDGDVIHVYDNAATGLFAGVAPEAMAGRRASEFGASPEVLALWLRHYAEAQARGGPVHFEYDHPGEDGPRWLSATVAPVGTGPSGRPMFCYVSEDATDRRRAEADRRAADGRFHSLAESLPLLAWEARPDGHIFWYNSRWYEYTGTTPEEMQGWGWQSVHDPGVLPSVMEGWQRAIASGSPFEMTFPLRGADGVFRPFLTRVTVVKDDRGRVLRWVGTNTDVTEAEAARAGAEAANRLKDEFLTTLSHELRTPLNAILGWAKLLRSDAVDPADLDEGLEVIERNSRAQAQLIEDLLDVSRIVSGKLALEVQPADLEDVIDAALTAVRPAAEAKGVRLSRLLDSLAGPVRGDPARLQQVVWNLLANAVKFTPAGGKVQVLLERVNSHVEVSVIDTGAGILPEFLPHVFERFRQADGSTTRRHGGLGLGLSIVKQLVEMHGGTVRAKSPGPGLGATFVVALPIATVHPEAEADPRPRPGGADPADPEPGGEVLDGLRVLIVDDEADARGLMRRVLSGCGATVAAAASADEALRLLGESAPRSWSATSGCPAATATTSCARSASSSRARTCPPPPSPPSPAPRTASARCSPGSRPTWPSPWTPRN